MQKNNMMALMMTATKTATATAMPTVVLWFEDFDLLVSEPSVVELTDGILINFSCEPS